MAAGREWSPASVVTDTNVSADEPSAITLRSQLMEPIKRVREIPAVSMRVLPSLPSASGPGGGGGGGSGARYVYDFGQEFAGVARLTLPPGVPAGVNVSLQFGEALGRDGRGGPRAERVHGQPVLVTPGRLLYHARSRRRRRRRDGC